MARSRKRRKRKEKGKPGAHKARRESAGVELTPPAATARPAKPPAAVTPETLDLEQAAAQLGLEEEAIIALISAGRLPMVRRSGRLEVASARIADRAGLSAAEGGEVARMPPAPPRLIPARLWPLRDAILALREPLPVPVAPPPKPEPPPLRIRIGIGRPAVPPTDRRELSFAQTYSSVKLEFGDEPVLIERLARRDVRGFRFGPDLLVPRRDLQGLPLRAVPALRGVEEPPAIPGVTADRVRPRQLPREEIEETPPTATRAETQLGIDIVDEAIVASSLTEESLQGQVEAPSEEAAEVEASAPAEEAAEVEASAPAEEAAEVEASAPAGAAGESQQSQLESIIRVLDRSGDGDEASRRKVLVGRPVAAQVAKTGAVLVGVFGDQRKAWRLGAGLVIIGRGRSMTGGEQRIVLADSALAIDHASITWNGNGFDITDHGYESGTQVDRRRLAATDTRKLETGALIQAGGLSALLLFSCLGSDGKRRDAPGMPAKALLDYLVFRKLISKERVGEVEREMARADVCVEEVLVVAGDVEPARLKSLLAEAAKVGAAGVEASESEWMTLAIRSLVVLVVLAVLGTVALVLLSG